MKDISGSLKVVVLDNDSGRREILKSLLVDLGHVPLCFESETICCENLDVITPDMVLCITEGTNLALRTAYAIKLIQPTLPLVFISESRSSLGKLEKIFKNNISCLGLPIDAQKLRKCIETLLRQEGELRSDFSPLVGECTAIAACRDMIAELRGLKDSIFIMGEKGTGRELIARDIVGGHNAERKNFVKLDSGQIAKVYQKNSDRLMTRLLQLEKYVASQDMVTILVSEIEKLPLHFQSGLLGLIDKFYNPARAKMDVKFIITAANGIKTLLAKKLFRNDLFFRLNVISITVPPLRSRRKDIDLLVDYFTYKYCLEFKRSYFRISDKARSVFKNYNWPGNVEELENAVRRIVITGNEQFVLEAPPFAAATSGNNKMKMLNFVPGTNGLVAQLQNMIDKGIDFELLRICEEFSRATERRLIRMALHQTNWNRKKAAALLKISYKSMLNKIKEYNLA